MDVINENKNPELTSKYSQYFVEKKTGEVYSALELKKKALKDLQKIIQENPPSIFALEIEDCLKLQEDILGFKLN